MTVKDDVYKSFNSKTTKELQGIRNTNDRNDYLTVDCKTIEEILDKRKNQDKVLNNTLDKDYLISTKGGRSWK